MITDRSCFILVGPEDQVRLTDSEAGTAPRIDYRVVAELLGADVVECSPPPTAFQGPKSVRLLRSVSGNLRAAWSLVQQVPSSSIIYSTGETWGFPVALAGMFTRRRHLSHVVYVHRVFSSKWLRFLRTTRRWLAVDGWICVTQQQARLLRAALGPTGAPIAVVSQGVDTEFFAPSKAAPPTSPPYILSVGIEMRNYELLFDAVRSLAANVVVKASSAWMAGGRSQLTSIPPNVTLITKRLSYVELRDLYAGAALVVVPLHETPQAAGITTILEAMAMNRCVIATCSNGLPDILVTGKTGVIVEPTISALSDVMAKLLAAPQQRAKLAYTALQAVSSSTTIADHARQVAGCLTSTSSRSKP